MICIWLYYFLIKFCLWQFIHIYIKCILALLSPMLFHCPPIPLDPPLLPINPSPRFMVFHFVLWPTYFNKGIQCWLDWKYSMKLIGVTMHIVLNTEALSLFLILLKLYSWTVRCGASGTLLYPCLTTDRSVLTQAQWKPFPLVFKTGSVTILGI